MSSSGLQLEKLPVSSVKLEDVALDKGPKVEPSFSQPERSNFAKASAKRSVTRIVAEGGSGGGNSLGLDLLNLGNGGFGSQRDTFGDPFAGGMFFDQYSDRNDNQFGKEEIFDLDSDFGAYLGKRRPSEESLGDGINLDDNFLMFGKGDRGRLSADRSSGLDFDEFF